LHIATFSYYNDNPFKSQCVLQRMNLSLLSKKHKSTILFSSVFLFVILIANFSFAATLETTDVFGNLKTDFSPEELVYIHGEGFNAFSPIQVDVTRPNSVVDSGVTISNSSGGFLFVYQLDGIVGDYLIEATDGINSAQLTFTDAAIWTTTGSCGNDQQDVNHFSPGEAVYINGNGFSIGTYSWSIKGLPGGASCDSNINVASGTKPVNASGAFCFNAYNVSSGDCGEYQVKFSNKGDNYRVVGNICQNDSQCGQPSSNLVCQGNDIYNQTSTPGCVGGSCNVTNSSSFVESCGDPSEFSFCFHDFKVTVTTTPTCGGGECNNETEITAVEFCEEGCSLGQCIDEEPVCGNGIVEQGEQCDDGNQNNLDDCRNTCVFPICGDGILDEQLNEECETNVSCQDTDCDYLDGCYDNKLRDCSDVSNTCDLNDTCGCTNNSCLSVDQCVLAGTDLDQDGFDAQCGDCNDTDPNINPDATEICDGKDNDCDGQIDEGFDKDNDGIADCFDSCPNSKPNEPVDQNGCDIFQFCGQLTCGFNCFEADWRDNEDTKHPNDCTVVIPLRNGIEQQPICVPTVATEFCAG